MALKAETIILAHGGEVSLTDNDYQELLKISPTIPRTHWRTVKKTLLKPFKKFV